MKPHGARLIAVEDITGAISNPDGIDAEALAVYVTVYKERGIFPSRNAAKRR
jgi:hypothetical protein